MSWEEIEPFLGLGLSVGFFLGVMFERGLNALERWLIAYVDRRTH